MNIKGSIAIAACLLIAVEVFALKPSREYELTPDMFGMNFKEHTIPSTDDAQLHAWYFEAPVRTSNFMIISGNGDGNMADYLEQVAQFLSLGYNVLTYDYRGYGKSSDFRIVERFYIYPQFSHDLNAVCDYVRRTFTNTFSLYGVGIGAGLSIGVGIERREVKSVIADSPFLTLESMQKSLEEVKGENVLIPPVFNKNHEPLHALDKSEFNRIFEGILIIVGADDKIIGPEQVKLLQNKQRRLVHVYTVPNAESDKTFSSNRNAYFTRIKEFLK